MVVKASEPRWPFARPARVPWRLRRHQEFFVAGNRVRLLRDGAQAFPRMLAAIADAQTQVLMEMYWMASDRVGWRFAEALGQAARRGCEVLVLYDSLGCWDTSSALFEYLRERGVGVREFNPLAPWKRRFRLDHTSRRDHRKILIVDAKVGFTGGINLAERWSPSDEGGGGWRDDMIELCGPAVAELTDHFEREWQGQGACREAVARVPAGPGGQGGSAVRVIAEAFAKGRREIKRAYLSNIYRAQRSVWITNSYFVPDRPVIRAIEKAALRGVDVRVLLPGVSDVPVVRYASRAVWTRLLRCGVRIFEWQNNVLHAKSAVVDGRWSTIGTFNLDYRSIFANLEVNVAVLDEAFAGEMEASFLADLSESMEVSLEEFRFRSPYERLLEWGSYGLRKLL